MTELHGKSGIIKVIAIQNKLHGCPSKTVLDGFQPKPYEVAQEDKSGNHESQ